MDSLVERLPLGAFVRKTKGSAWHGRIVGYYSTSLTPLGYAVESIHETGSVQIYPAAALETYEPPQVADRIEALEKALEPFATFADSFVDEEGWNGPMKTTRIVDWFGPSEFRDARKALGGDGV